MIDNEELEFIYYLFNENIIISKVYMTALYYQKAFRKIKHFKTCPAYGNIRVDGGKEVDKFEAIIDANKDYNNIIINLSQEDIDLLDKFVGVEISYKTVVKKNKDYQKIINRLVYVLINLMIINKQELNIMFDINDYRFILKHFIKHDGIDFIAKQINLAPNTIRKILSSNDFIYSNLEKLLDYYHI